jgi:hypothetical protein
MKNSTPSGLPTARTGGLSITMNQTILILRRCGDCEKAQIPMAVADFPFPIEFHGQVCHFIKDTYSFTSELNTGVKYPSQKNYETSFQVVSTKDHPVLVEL